MTLFLAGRGGLSKVAENYRVKIKFPELVNLEIGPIRSDEKSSDAHFCVNYENSQTQIDVLGSSFFASLITDLMTS